MEERTKKLLIDLFNAVKLSPEQPTPDELFDDAYELVNREVDVAEGLQPRRYSEQVDTQDAHYQALVALLQQEKQGELTQPPVTAHFDFGYLGPPLHKPWHVALGKIIITFTEQLLNTLVPNPSPQLAYQKSANETPIFTFGFEARPGVTVQVVGQAATVDTATCTVVAEVKTAARAWPKLSGIPVTLATEGTGATTLLTDPFGRVHFRTVERAHLPAATVTIGPLAELQTDAPG